MFPSVTSVNKFLYFSIISLHLISFSLNTRSLLVSYSHVSTKLIFCILLSLLALNAILLTSSVHTVCFLLLNICWNFNINILFFITPL